jgi:hypothetical protein
MLHILFKSLSYCKRFSFYRNKNFPKNILYKQSKYFIFNNFMMKSTEENRRIAQGTEHSVTKFEGKIGGEFEKQTSPKFLEEREKVWAELYQKQQEYQKSLSREKIIITLKDGKKVEATSFETTPLDIAKKYLKKSLVGDLIVAKVFIFLCYFLD